MPQDAEKNRRQPRRAGRRSESSDTPNVWILAFARRLKRTWWFGEYVVRIRVNGGATKLKYVYASSIEIESDQAR
jgi:hypothetical protein